MPHQRLVDLPSHSGYSQQQEEEAELKQRQLADELYLTQTPDPLRYRSRTPSTICRGARHVPNSAPLLVSTTSDTNSSSAQRSVAPPDRPRELWGGRTHSAGGYEDETASSRGASAGDPCMTRGTTLFFSSGTPIHAAATAASRNGSGWPQCGSDGGGEALLSPSAQPHRLRSQVSYGSRSRGGNSVPTGSCHGAHTIGSAGRGRATTLFISRQSSGDEERSGMGESERWLLASPCVTAPAHMTSAIHSDITATVAGIAKTGGSGCYSTHWYATVPPLPPAQRMVDAGCPVCEEADLFPPVGLYTQAPSTSTWGVHSLKDEEPHLPTTAISPPRRRTGRLSTVRSPDHPSSTEGVSAAAIARALNAGIDESNSLSGGPHSHPPPQQHPPPFSAGGVFGFPTGEHGWTHKPLSPPHSVANDACSQRLHEEGPDEGDLGTPASTLAELEAAPRKSYARECFGNDPHAHVAAAHARLTMDDVEGITETESEARQMGVPFEHRGCSYRQPSMNDYGNGLLLCVTQARLAAPSWAEADASELSSWPSRYLSRTAASADWQDAELSQAIIPVPTLDVQPADSAVSGAFGGSDSNCYPPYGAAPAHTNGAVQADGCFVDSAGVLLSHITAAGAPTQDSVTMSVGEQLAQLTIHGSPTQKRLAFDDAAEEASVRSNPGPSGATAEAGSTAMAAVGSFAMGTGEQCIGSQGGPSKSTSPRWDAARGRGGDDEEEGHRCDTPSGGDIYVPRTVPSSPVTIPEPMGSPATPAARHRLPRPIAGASASSLSSSTLAVASARRRPARPTGLQLLQSRKRCLDDRSEGENDKDSDEGSRGSEWSGGMGTAHASPTSGPLYGGNRGQSTATRGSSVGTSVDLEYLASIKRCRRECERYRQQHQQRGGSERGGYRFSSPRRTSSAPAPSSAVLSNTNGGVNSASTTALGRGHDVLQELPSNTFLVPSSTALLCARGH